ncbi:5-fold beta-flower protein [Telluribacter humicola]|uniref:5-fold beta-flower protein n=1 Tax=Telluribacter humicola TaxID=1720261 RepID=UPI001A95D63C|nr:hypothetical protein [Telluribacter humicola]
MNTFRTAFACLVFLLSIHSFLQAQNVSYKQPFTISQNGLIKNASGQTIGNVSMNQIIKDHTGTKIAFVDAQGNLIDAISSKKLGRVGKDGNTYYNAKGQLHLVVKEKGETCDIFDAKGNKIGNVHSSLKKSACALQCFQQQHNSRP